MTTQNTCLVFGAGVSWSYGFPTGRGLYIEICAHLAEGANLWRALVVIGFDAAHVELFRKELRDSHAQSVDRFAANRPQFADIATFAIAAELLPQEDPHQISPHGTERIYEYIWTRVGRDIETFKHNRLSIVTFNYDRSLEYFLLAAIRGHFGVPPDEAAALLAGSIEIVHMYGQLGLAGIIGLGILPFGGQITNESLHVAAKQIQLIRDDTADTANIIAAKRLIGRADNIMLLGFGYDPTNVRRLGIQKTVQGPRTLGTALGLQNDERIHASTLFPEAGISLGDVGENAYDFLRRYSAILA